MKIPSLHKSEEATWYIEKAINDFITGDELLDTSQITNWEELSYEERDLIEEYALFARKLYRKNLDKTWLFDPENSEGLMLELQQKLNSKDPDLFEKLITNNEFGVT